MVLSWIIGLKTDYLNVCACDKTGDVQRELATKNHPVLQNEP